MSPPLFRDHTAAVVAALDAVAGLVVGRGEMPTLAAGADKKYCVVYSIPGGRLSGSLEDAEEDGELVYQVTCVGETNDQAEWVVDKVMALLDGIGPVQGRVIPRVALESMPGVFRDESIDPPLFVATPRFRIFTTPE